MNKTYINYGAASGLPLFLSKRWPGITVIVNGLDHGVWNWAQNELGFNIKVYHEIIDELPESDQVAFVGMELNEPLPQQFNGSRLVLCKFRDSCTSTEIYDEIIQIRELSYGDKTHYFDVYTGNKETCESMSYHYPDVEFDTARQPPDYDITIEMFQKYRR